MRSENENIKFYTWKDNDYVTVYEPEIKDKGIYHIDTYTEKDKHYIDFKPCDYLDVTYKCELNKDLYNVDHMKFNQLHPMYIYAIFQHLKVIDINKYRGKILKYDVFVTVEFDAVITNNDNPEDVSRYRRKEFKVA